MTVPRDQVSGPSPTPTLYEALGGSEGVLRLATAWHERVLADEIVAHAFSHGFHPQHTERLAAYGGESSVVRIHSGNGPHEEMDRRAIECFDRAMGDVGVTNPLLSRVLNDYFVWTTTVTMSAYPQAAADVPNGLHIP